MVFLDDCFETKTSYDTLTAAGFWVERFSVHFPDERDQRQRRQSIKDPRVIRLCHLNGYLLVTTDREMRTTFIEDLKKTDIGVLATANNNEGDDIWAKRIVEQKTKILRDFKRAERPYFSIIQKTGRITTETITKQMTTRRTRPQEQDNHLPTGIPGADED